jgi:hypothetical protein
MNHLLNVIGFNKNNIFWNIPRKKGIPSDQWRAEAKKLFQLPGQYFDEIL